MHNGVNCYWLPTPVGYDSLSTVSLRMIVGLGWLMSHRLLITRVLLAVAAIVLVACPTGPNRLDAQEPPMADATPGTGPGVREIVPVPTLGGKQFWADELFFHGWRIQRNAVTGHCRLLDQNDLRHAWGAFESCRGVLEEIKTANNLPPMRGNAVLLLHGLGDSRASMQAMAKYIERLGDYTVLNFGYPSTRQAIADHAKTLARAVGNLEGIAEINLVGHSMGNIVIRRYLADETDEAAGRRPDRRINRIVMLGPPNHGSMAATALGDNRVFKIITGRSGQELGAEWVWLESSLATPKCQFGIVAGGLLNNAGFNPVLPGDNDGLVTIRSARLAGATDFIVVPVIHALLPDSEKVQQYTLCFLDNGYFVSADRRRPLMEE